MVKDGNKKIIILTLLCILSFIIAIFGFVLFLQGYGKNGSIRKQLIPIVDKFNSLEDIKALKDININARYKNNTIYVSCENDRISLEFQFDYEKNDNLNIIKTTYSESKDEFAQIVIKNIIDSISILNGNNEGDVFKEYSYNDFFKTKLSDGVHFINRGGLTIAEIVINTNLIENIKNKSFDEENNDYISSNDLNNMKIELTNNSSFLINKNSITLYVVEKNDKYIIYISDIINNKENIKNSLLSTIGLIDNIVYNDIIQSDVDFTKQIYNKNYEITINPEIIENNQEILGDVIIMVSINK